MSDKNSSLFIIAYKGRSTADEVYDALHDLQKEDKIKIKTAATAYRKDNGKIKLWHRHRVTFWKGLWGGGAIGLVLGALTAAAAGPAVVGAAAVGGLVGLSRSRQRRDAKKFLDDNLGLNDSALVILIKSADWDAVDAVVKPYNGEVLSMELTEIAEAQLAEMADDPEVVAVVEEEVEIQAED